MTRFNLQFGGKAEELLKRIKGRRKSILLNSIVGEAIRTGKIKEHLSTFFSNEEIEEILDFNKKFDFKKTEKNTQQVNSDDKIQTNEAKEKTNFSVEL